MGFRQWALMIALVLAGGLAGYFLRGSPAASPQAAVGQGGPGGSFQQGNRNPQGQGSQGFRSGQGRGGAGAVIPVQTAKTRSGTLVAQRQAAGTVVPTNQSRVAAPSGGVVARVLVKVGDTVKAGQPVIQLDDTQLRLTVQNAEIALQNARISLSSQTNAIREASLKLSQQLQAAKATLVAVQNSYASAQKVHQLGGISANDLQNAKSQLSTAQANVTAAQAALDQNQRAGNEALAQLRLAITQAQNQLRQAQINLANATIKAPFDGQIAAINVSPGESVGSSTQAFTLVSLERQVAFSVPPSDAPSLTPGQQLSFNTGSQSFAVKVNQRPAAPVNQSVALTARFIGEAVAAPGAVGNLSYRVRLAQGTLLPIAALQNDGIRSYVFTIVEGKAKAQNVTVLAQAGSDAAVRGIPGGAEVIVSPPPGLLDGASVVNQEEAGQRGQFGGQGGQQGQGQPGQGGSGQNRQGQGFQPGGPGNQQGQNQSGQNGQGWRQGNQGGQRNPRGQGSGQPGQGAQPGSPQGGANPPTQPQGGQP